MNNSKRLAKNPSLFGEVAAKMTPLVLGAILLTACTESTRWTEELQINDGRTIAVTRIATVERHHLTELRGFMIGQSLEIQPGVRWTGRGNETPFTLEIIHHTPTVVSYIDYEKSCLMNESAIYPLSIVQFKNGTWEAVPEGSLPLHEFKINLLGNIWGGSAAYDVKGQVSILQKSGRDRRVGRNLIDYLRETRLTCETIKRSHKPI